MTKKKEMKFIDTHELAQKTGNLPMILACPFCGDEAFLMNTHTPSYWIECGGCGAEVSDVIGTYSNEKEHQSNKLHRESAIRAIANWNRRI